MLTLKEWRDKYPQYQALDLTKDNPIVERIPVSYEIKEATKYKVDAEDPVQRKIQQALVEYRSF